jgi:hypothetical protein
VLRTTVPDPFLNHAGRYNQLQNHRRATLS